VPGLVDGAEDQPRALQVRGSGVGELDPAGGAAQQLDAEVSLEAADLLRQRGLGHVQPGGGVAEVQLLGDGHEVPQLAQIH
jgi:hypothetical protein